MYMKHLALSRCLINVNTVSSTFTVHPLTVSPTCWLRYADSFLQLTCFNYYPPSHSLFWMPIHPSSLGQAILIPQKLLLFKSENKRVGAEVHSLGIAQGRGRASQALLLGFQSDWWSQLFRPGSWSVSQETHSNLTATFLGHILYWNCGGFLWFSIIFQYL